MGHHYTPEELDAIAGWLNENCSAGRIAALMRARGVNLTRNAIIGIVYRNKTLKRIGLKGRAPQQQKRSKIAGVLAAPKVKPQPKQHPMPVAIIGPNVKMQAGRKPLDPVRPVRAAPVAPRQRKPVPLLKLKPGQCKFPVEASKAVGWHLFCAKPATEGSYCSQHHEICHGVGTFPERAAVRTLGRAA
jgi:hypothetical protein